MDAQGSTFTQNGFNVTSAGLGLTNLSMEMSGSSLALGSTPLSVDATTPSAQNVLQLKNAAAASTGSTVSAANPSVTYNFVADSHLDGTDPATATTDNSQTSALGLVASALDKSGLTSFTLGTDGLLSTPANADPSALTIKSHTTASDGSVTYALSNGDSIVQAKDGNGNSVFTANTAFDANGNVTTKTVVTDVNMSSAASLSTTGGTSSAQSVKQVDLMTQAMEYQGFGVSRDASNNLTVAGNSIDATSTQMGTFGKTPSIALGATPFSSTSPMSAIQVGDNTFVAQTVASDTSAVDALGNMVGSSNISALALTNGTLTATAGTWTLSTTPTTNTDGSKSYALTATSGGTAEGTITQSTDSQGNAVYSYTKAGSATTKTITNIDMPSDATPAAQIKQMTNAMAAQGITASADATNTLSIISSDTISMESIAAGTGVMSTDSTRAVATAGIQSFTGETKATAVTGASVVSAVVQAAISSVTRTASSIGYSSTTISNLQTSTSSLSDALTTGVGALTDADLAAESAKLTSLQTKQQLAVQSLSIANSQSSTLLSLFRG